MDPQTHAWTTAPQRALGGLVAGSVLDADLAATLWLLVEGGVPWLVCGPDGQDLDGVVVALLDLGQHAGATERPREPAGRARGPVRGPVHRPWNTLRAGSLREAMAVLQGDPFHLSDDQLRALGVIVVVDGNRVVAAHYIRPVERDREGHLQRRPPVVLATWNPERGAYEHFAWGVTPELAVRIGRTQADFEEEQARRRRTLQAAPALRPALGSNPIGG
jgi:hypothetical protein